MMKQTLLFTFIISSLGHPVYSMDVTKNETVSEQTVNGTATLSDRQKQALENYTKNDFPSSPSISEEQEKTLQSSSQESESSKSNSLYMKFSTVPVKTPIHRPFDNQFTK